MTRNSRDEGINTNDSGGDDDFFASLRVRQTTNEDEAQAAAEKSNETMVDSTPSMMALETNQNNHGNIPDLTSNISPTSISTASSDEKFSEDDFTAYFKAEKGPRTTSDLIAAAPFPINVTKSVLFLRLGLIFLVLLSSASWFGQDEQNTELFEVSGSIVSEHTFNLSHYQEALQMSIDFFQFSQYSNEVPHFEEEIENEIQNHAIFSGEEDSPNQIQEQLDDVIDLDTYVYQPPKESTSETPPTNPPEDQSITINIIQQRRSKTTMSGYVLKKVYGRSIRIHVQQQKMTPLPSSSDLPMNKTTSMIVQKIKGLSEQLANILASVTGDLAKYLDLTAKSAKFRLHNDINNIAHHTNNVMKNLASQNAEIQAGSHSMVGGRESLAHVGAAAKKILSKIDHQVSDIAQASTNAELQANNFHMTGVRESFTKIGTTVQKRTSRIISRKLDITAISI